MSDVFDISGNVYQNLHKSIDYIHSQEDSWIREDPKKNSHKSRVNEASNKYSKSPLHERGWRSPKLLSQGVSEMYNHQTQNQHYPSQPIAQPQMYSEYNNVYASTPATAYQHNFQQPYQISQNSTDYQYNQQRNYRSQSTQPAQGYNAVQHQQQPGPPGDDYPGSAWTSVHQQQQQQQVPAAYLPINQSHCQTDRRSSSVTSTGHSDTVQSDDLRKEAAIAHELNQHRATLLKQRDDYLRKANVLRRELDKLRSQKHELLAEKSPARESQRILRENANLQLEIQVKLKSIYNVVDMLSGIIGDGLKAADCEDKINSNDSSPKHRQLERIRKNSSHLPDSDFSNEEQQSTRNVRESCEKEDDHSRYNYVHYDPELHWCRVCDVFPSSAKEFLTHLHSAEHRQMTQEHQLVDVPWHKLPIDPMFPSKKGAPLKRVPIKGLQFFISAPAWYCKLCDTWIGDLHCASLHLKSKIHAHNYSHFVEQNPQWESNWIKDREKAFSRCTKVKHESNESSIASILSDPSLNNDKSKLRNLKVKHELLDNVKDKKRKKKSKKRKKMNSSGSSSSSSSSTNSSSEEDDDKAKSIRVSMRNKMRLQAQMILNEEIGNKVEILEKLIEERNRKKEEKKSPPDAIVEDNIINQWMTVSHPKEKRFSDNLKDRVKQRQNKPEEKIMEVSVEQRRRERDREERELKELREREQREMQDRMRDEQERDRRERDRIKDREKFRRKRLSDSRSPDYYDIRDRNSHSRSENSRQNRGHSNDRYHIDNENEKFKPKSREYEDDESQFEKRSSESLKFKQNKNQQNSQLNSKKLPFIGRMPLYKKKPSDSAANNSHWNSKMSRKKTKEDYDVRLSKFESGTTARQFIPEPGVVHITKLATPLDPNQTTIQLNAENPPPPPPPKIIPEPPQITDIVPPPPPIFDTILAPGDETDVQDMELDEAVALPPGVPISEAKPIAKPAGNNLPRDFEEALNIIFPGDQRPDHLAVQNDPNLMMHYQYGMQYGMMYSGMQMYDYSVTAEAEIPPVPETDKSEELVPPPPPDLDDIDDKEDLAMLGIDEEDMAAQTF